MSNQHTTLEQRLWSRVEKTQACWLWMGTTHRGYGRLNDGSGRTLRAHRVAYELTNGPVPAGMVLDHLCRVRNCVNPAHLEVVTNRINVLRGIGVTAINASALTCPRKHPYDTTNTYTDKRGRRSCRVCHIESSRASHRRVRKAALALLQPSGNPGELPDRG